MDNALTYQDFLHRINIQDVLLDVGYVNNRRDGLRYPSFVRLDRDGRRIRGDKFLVTPDGQRCFQPPQQRTYNVISFIKEHPQMFADYRPGMNLDHLVNIVGNRLLNNPIPDREHKIISPKKDYPPFDISKYSIQKFDPEDKKSQNRFFPYFKDRGIRLSTQKDFHEFFSLNTENIDNGKDKYAHTNISFPLTKPNDDTIIGFEIRGKRREDGSSFKGKAQGSNGSEGLWIANLAHTPLDKVTDVTWFESAYDAMAEYQLMKSHFGVSDAMTRPQVRVSTGGNPTMSQIRSMLSATPNATHYLSFDNDEAGERFVEMFRNVAKGMGLAEDKVQLATPRGFYKDWNDALLGKEDATLRGKGGESYDYSTRTPGYSYHEKEDVKDSLNFSFTEINFNGETYRCREIPDKDGEMLIIGSNELMDALQPNPAGSALDGFASPLAERIYDRVFYFTDKDSLDKLDDKALITEISEANPDFFIAPSQEKDVEIVSTYPLDTSLPTKGDTEGISPRLNSAYIPFIDDAAQLHRQLIKDLGVEELNSGPLRQSYNTSDDEVSYSAHIDLDKGYQLRTNLVHKIAENSLDFHHIKFDVVNPDGNGGVVVSLPAPLTYNQLVDKIREKTDSIISSEKQESSVSQSDAAFVKSLLGKPLVNANGTSLHIQSMKNDFVVYKLHNEPGIINVSSMADLIKSQDFKERPVSSVQLPSTYLLEGADTDDLRDKVDATADVIIEDFKRFSNVLAKDLGLENSPVKWEPYFKDPEHPSIQAHIDIGENQRVGTLRLVALYKPSSDRARLDLTTVAAQIVEAYKPDKLIEQDHDLNYPKFINDVRERFDAIDPQILSSGRYQQDEDALPFRIEMNKDIPDYEPERRVNDVEGDVLNKSLQLAERLLDDIGVREELKDAFGEGHPRIDDDVIADGDTYGIQTHFSIPLGNEVMMDMSIKYSDKTRQHDALALDNITAQVSRGDEHYDVPTNENNYQALLASIRDTVSKHFFAMEDIEGKKESAVSIPPVDNDNNLARYEQEFRQFHQNVVRALGVEDLNEEVSSLETLPKIEIAVPDTAEFANYNYKINLPNDTHIEGGFTLRKGYEDKYNFYHSHAYIINSTGLDSHIEYDIELPYSKLQDKLNSLVKNSHFLDVSPEEENVSFGLHR